MTATSPCEDVEIETEVPKRSTGMDIDTCELIFCSCTQLVPSKRKMYAEPASVPMSGTSSDPAPTIARLPLMETDVPKRSPANTSLGVSAAAPQLGLPIGVRHVSVSRYAMIW